MVNVYRTEGVLLIYNYHYCYITAKFELRGTIYNNSNPCVNLDFMKILG